MLRSSTLIAGMLVIYLTAGICVAAEKLPTVEIILPQEMVSESVQIRYFMVGPFGGYGDFTKLQPNLRSYKIEAATCREDLASGCAHKQSLAATNIKFIIYSPGCQIATFDFNLEESSAIKQEFICQPLRTTLLTGQITDKQILSEKSLRLAVEYEASWDHEFFGIMDGMVTMIPLATATVDENGAFSVQLPDFGVDPIASTREGSLLFELEEARTGNLVGELKPVQKRAGCLGLCIQSPYPQNLPFKIKLFEN